MTEGAFAAWLRAEGAHHDVVRWAEPYGDDAPRALRECPRGDWLLGIAVRLGAPRVALVRAAVACAGEAALYGAEENAHARAALERAEAFTRGEASAEACAEAAARAEAVADACPHAAMGASVRAAAAAARTAFDAEAGAVAAALAVDAAVLDAGDCAMMQALGYMHDRCARRVRESIDLTQLELPARRVQGR